MTRLARWLGCALLMGAAVAAFGCESIVGIEDRTVETCDAQCKECEHYCDLAMTNCTDALAVYTDRAICLNICHELPLGDPLEPGAENTIACREHQAELALSTGEPDAHCSSVGPGGGGLCGNDCESYCYLFPRICPNDQPMSNADCLKKCPALEDGPDYSVDDYYDSDSLECRLIHLGNATADPMHCSHAGFQSSKHCMPPDMQPPDCADYCRVVMVACDGNRKNYDDTATCLATCPKLTPGLNGETTGNTLGCRQYHSYSALLDPVTHCSHAGPGGAGHCGDPEGVGNCESYCMLAKAGCPAQFATVFANSDAQCQADCKDLRGSKDDPATMDVNEGEQYNVPFAESGALPFQCRLLHVTRALNLGTDSPTECASAFGVPGSACQ